MKMKTIIVEDEANILSETKRNLERMADIEVVGRIPVSSRSVEICSWP